jgi:hypothetical protein
MTEQHYKSLAEILGRYYDVMDPIDFHQLVKDISNWLEKNNERFDNNLFYDECMNL